MTLKPGNYNYRRTNGTSLTGGKWMGYVHAEIELTNQSDVELNYHGLVPENEIRRVTTTALVDTGAWDLVINEEVQQRLNLRVLGKQLVKLADETLLEVEIVGPVAIRFEDRSTIMTAIVLPATTEVLLGAYPLEGLDAFIDPKRQKLLLNPKSPNNPTAYIRQVSLSI
jgi:clan AA aspartic protease